MSLKAEINNAMKDAMRAKDKPRLGAIRLIQAEVKRIEVDERIEIDDQRLVAIMDKMVKQRRDSASQYRDADRPELADKEDAEIAIIQTFLPAQLTDDEIDATRNWLKQKSLTIAGGTKEVQMNIIAKRVLGLPDA